MDLRPRLTRPIHPLARPDGSIQLGLDPRTALVATGVSARECRWLATLDGSRVRAAVIADAAGHGIARDRAGEIIDAFVAQGLVTEAERAHAIARRVAVVGAGTVPAHLTEVLREAGLADVQRQVHDIADDVEAEGRVDLAIITSTVPVPAGAGEVWRLAGVPHLPVWCGPDHASVGPLIVPGTGPCLQCLELTRLALDPGWSWIRAQISGPRIGPLVPVETAATTRSILVGIAASLALEALTDGPAATGWSIDASAPGPTFERRHWSRQPACPRCGPGVTTREGTPLSGDGQVDPQQWAV